MHNTMVLLGHLQTTGHVIQLLKESVLLKSLSFLSSKLDIKTAIQEAMLSENLLDKVLTRKGGS